MSANQEFSTFTNALTDQINKIKVAEEEEGIKEGETCYFRLSIKGDDATRTLFLNENFVWHNFDHITGDECDEVWQDLDFSKSMPLPEHIQEASKKVKQTWRGNNWGTCSAFGFMDGDEVNDVSDLDWFHAEVSTRPPLGWLKHVA